MSPRIVFVIDDDEDLRGAIRDSLEERGYLVECFARAEAALAAIGCGHPISIVLMSGDARFKQTIPEDVRVLPKPFEMDRLLEAVDGAFD